MQHVYQQLINNLHTVMYITKCYVLNVVNGEMLYTVGQSSPTSFSQCHHQVRNVIQILQHLATHLFGRRRIRVDVREDSADGKAETQLGLTNSATGAFWRLLPHLAVASWFGIILSFVFFFLFIPLPSTARDDRTILGSTSLDSVL